MTKESIIAGLEKMRAKNLAAAELLPDRVSLDEYSRFVRSEDGFEVWTDALQMALAEHQVIVIPARKEPYYIDDSVVIPSKRLILADGATLRLTPDCEVLMFRNLSTANGTHAPIGSIKDNLPDTDITIIGGRFEESRTKRGGYGTSGKYDKSRSLYGVSTLFFFNNICGLSLVGLTFAHTAGFAVQVGDAKNLVFEHIRFEECYADGLHINGNTENLICRDIKGQVGDDLVALNLYDWQNSSVDFGPMTRVLCEDLELSDDSGYKAMRIEPGRYIYDDGSIAECTLSDAVIKNVRGIRTFKLYYQTPRYKIGNPPERGMVGKCGNVYFEDIKIDLLEPIDRFPEYMNSDPVRGNFAAFELGADIENLCLENIDLTLYPEKFPMSGLVCAGPKSIRKGDVEIFDPYVSCTVKKLTLSDIRINGERVTKNRPGIFSEITFDDVNNDNSSSGSGKFDEILLDGVRIK